MHPKKKNPQIPKILGKTRHPKQNKPKNNTQHLRLHKQKRRNVHLERIPNPLKFELPKNKQKHKKSEKKAEKALQRQKKRKILPFKIRRNFHKKKQICFHKEKNGRF